MEESLLKIKNKLKDFISFKTINPHAHWNFLLYLFFIFIIILIIFSFYLLNKIRNQQIFQITSTPTELPSLINEKLLERVNESFNLKLIKEKEINKGSVIFKDPSIN